MARRFLVLALALLALLPGVKPAWAGTSIVVASTTSTDQSGLFGFILPIFEQDTGISVKVVALGTGQAMEVGKRGDADALLVHDRAKEDAFVAQGYGAYRRDVMYNDFVIIGPAADPAGVKAASGAVDAYRRIAAAGAVFISRADKSGTHGAELRFWRAAGVDPAGKAWYKESGSGMGPTLNMAAGLAGYTMSDRGTWANFHNRQDLQVLFAGDARLYNPYGVILVNPARHPHIKRAEAERFIDWITSDAGRRAIAAYRIGGEQLFYPLPTR
jgi:tungstate transport system substrate-binding protein